MTQKELKKTYFHCDPFEKENIRNRSQSLL